MLIGSLPFAMLCGVTALFELFSLGGRGNTAGHIDIYTSYYPSHWLLSSKSGLTPHISDAQCKHMHVLYINTVSSARNG